MKKVVKAIIAVGMLSAAFGLTLVESLPVTEGFRLVKHADPIHPPVGVVEVAAHADPIYPPIG